MDNCDILVKKVDEVHLKVFCTEDISRELSEHFTFQHPNQGARYGRKGWDGLVRLYNRRSCTLYVGLLPYVKEFAKQRNYSIVCDPQLDLADEFSAIEAKNFADSLNPHTKNMKIDIRDYQYKALLYAIRDRRMLLVSPTSSGKSLIAYIIIRYLNEVKGCKKGLLIVPTINLVEQMYSDFIDYSSHNGFSTEATAHRVYEGKPLDDPSKKLIISTWQSIHQLPQEYFEQFDYIIGDEAHTFQSSSLRNIMSKSKNASYRIGMTGTLSGAEIHQLILEGLFGRKRQFITTKQLQDRKEIAQLSIKCLFLTYPKAVSNMVLESRYHGELDFIFAHKARNNFIKNLALSLEGNTLLLFQYVEKHGVIIKNLLEEEAEKYKKRVYFVYGGTDVEQRNNIRGWADKYPSDSIINASYGTFSTGANIRNIHNVIFTSPTKSRIRVLQSIGRGLRMGEFKDHCTLFDIVDDFSNGSEINTTLDHFQERLSYYIAEKFNYRLYNVNIKGDHE